MKGMAVGTIISWAGQLGGGGGIPAGWLPCVGGRTYRISDYPDLYDVIGNRYGGSPPDGNFLLPNITSKSLGDYHPSHSNVTNIGYTGNFSTFLGTNTDIANQNIVTQSSNIDLFVNFRNPDATNLKASLSGHNINQSSFSDTCSVVERRLGDAHIATHSHDTILDSVRTTNTLSEACEQTFLGFVNGGLGCNDICATFEYYRTSNNTGSEDDFAVPKFDGGQHVGGGKPPYGTNEYKMQRIDSPDRNYILESDDCVMFNTSGNNGCRTTNDCGNSFGGIYGTSLSTNVVNFETSALSGHVHRDILFTINTGNVATKEIVNVNNIYTAITPANNLTKDIMTIEVDVNTASTQLMYIIKAY